MNVIIKNLVVAVSLVMTSLFAFSISAEPLDDVLRSIDTIPQRHELESIPDVQNRLRAVVSDRTRSLYERSRALSFLMLWGHRDLLIAQTEPVLIKTAIFALAKYHGQELTKKEFTFFRTALEHSDRSVRIAVVRSAALLPNANARTLLTRARAGSEKVVAKIATREFEKRFIEAP